MKTTATKHSVNLTISIAKRLSSKCPGLSSVCYFHRINALQWSPTHACGYTVDLQIVYSISRRGPDRWESVQVSKSSTLEEDDHINIEFDSLLQHEICQSVSYVDYIHVRNTCQYNKARASMHVNTRHNNVDF